MNNKKFLSILFIVITLFSSSFCADFTFVVLGDRTGGLAISHLLLCGILREDGV